MGRDAKEILTPSSIEPSGAGGSVLAIPRPIETLSRGPVGKRSLRRAAWAWQSRYAPYLFVAPFAILFCIFMLWPLIDSVSMSFQKSAGPKLFRWVGLHNYGFLLTDRLFWLACINTVLYAVLFLPLELVLSLGLAILVNNPRVRFRSFFRFAFFSTYMIGQVFLAALMYVVLSPRQGFINVLIGALFPWIGSEMNWRGNPTLAVPGLVIASLWVSIGYAMVYWLAALQAVDRELYEAAQVDGAGPWTRFIHVTLPGIRPVGIFLLLVGTIASLSLFDLPYVYFQGAGPGLRGMTIVVYLYEQGFQTGDIGFAAAVGWVLVFLILIITLVQIKATRATEET